MKWYGASKNSFSKRLFEYFIEMAVNCLKHSQSMSFPDRSSGVWWWTWRWRFEILMRWNEHESVKLCSQLVKPGMIVIDIGAHIGYYTRLLSELVGRSGRVFAFEAHPDNYAVLKQNLRARKYSNVEMYNCAVSDQKGKMQLYVSPGSSNHSLLAGYTNASRIIDVKSINIDSFLSEKGIKSLDFMKMDVEGAEPLVFVGMRHTIVSSQKISLLVEYNPQALRSGNIIPEQFLRDLREMDFEIQIIPNDATMIQTLDGAENEVINILCRK
jgi:FkbM family methyltransferase